MKITKDMLATVKKGQSYAISPTEIIVDKDMNPRFDYGSGDEWESFKESIAVYGVQQNLKVFFDEETKTFHLAHGFRRMKAIQELLESMDDDDEVNENLQYVNIDIVEDNKEENIIGHFILNSGKPFNDVEMADALNRLKLLSGEENIAELARKVGLPYQKVNTLLKFAKNAGVQLKQAVASGEIPFSGAISIVKNTSSITEQNRMIKEAKAEAKTQGKTKVKSAHIKGIEPKLNLETKIGNLLASAEKYEVNKEGYNMFCSIVSALRENRPTEEIIPLFNIQLEEA